MKVNAFSNNLIFFNLCYICVIYFVKVGREHMPLPLLHDSSQTNLSYNNYYFFWKSFELTIYPTYLLHVAQVKITFFECGRIT